jgi:hypothetical protein
MFSDNVRRDRLRGEEQGRRNGFLQYEVLLQQENTPKKWNFEATNEIGCRYGDFNTGFCSGTSCGVFTELLL